MTRPTLEEAAQAIVANVGADRLNRNFNLESAAVPGDLLRDLRNALDAEKPKKTTPTV